MDGDPPLLGENREHGHNQRMVPAYFSPQVANNVGAFDARGLANSAWAFAKLRYMPVPELPGLISDAAHAKVGPGRYHKDLHFRL